ncbi:MAG TPA: diacylglycerol kinase family protein [Chloroflexia bacterium]|nr:diacylglycerol kinase family protein [Chloroflexia bacterium]
MADVAQQKDLSAVVEGQSAYTPEEAQPDNIPPGTRIKVIVNPASGKKGGITTNAAGPEEVSRLLLDNGIEADLVETEYAGHATDLAKAAKEEGYQIVIACGGDGTVGEVAMGLIGADVTLGILPLGSANNVARMMHVPFDLGEAAKLLRLGEVRKVDIGRCNGEYFLETAGVGLDAALFPILNQVDKGEYVRLLDVVRTFFRFRPRHVTLVLDRRAVRVKALVVLVANGPYWGYSVPLAPDAKVDDGLFDVVVFRNFSKSAFVRHVIGSLLGRDFPHKGAGAARPVQNPDIRTYKAKRVRVLTSGRRPLPVHADAQPRGRTPATIELVKGALRVITGPGEHVTNTSSKGTPKGEPPKHRLEES